MAEAQSMQKIHTERFGDCLQMKNQCIELLVSLNYGPRIVHFSTRDGCNIFAEDVEYAIETDEESYQIRGGHRLWHSPERMPRTYAADDAPVKEYSYDRGVLEVTQETEKRTQIEKKMLVSFSKENEVRVTHVLTNKNLWEVELGAWAISAVKPGGIQIIPNSAPDSGFLPNRLVALWPYTDMHDPRVHWGNEYIIIRHEKNNPRWLKIGIRNVCGWSAYLYDHYLFIKYCHVDPDAKYPDFGVNYETFSAEWGIEMENFSPLKKVKPGETVELVEHWRLSGNVGVDALSQESVTELIKAYL